MACVLACVGLRKELRAWPHCVCIGLAARSRMIASLTCTPPTEDTMMHLYHTLLVYVLQPLDLSEDCLSERVYIRVRVVVQNAHPH